jgi:hypothetical protein
MGVAEDVGISQPTVSRTFHAVLDKIVENAGLWIHFPSTVHEMQSAMDNWQTTYEMPCAIGAVDCTQVRVLKPQGRHAHGDEYVGQSGKATLNVQGICDAKETFTSVVAEWPGSVHDSRIWRNSVVCHRLSTMRTEALLLGDSGYGIAPWSLHLMGILSNRKR